MRQDKRAQPPSTLHFIVFNNKPAISASLRQTTELELLHMIAPCGDHQHPLCHIVPFFNTSDHL